jgi:putative peptidoglycan lipid II flippase
MRIGRAVAASSITISLCGLVGQAAAFVTTFLLASIFGASADVDAYAAAIAIPYFTIALIQASIGKAFVPVFVRELTNDRRGEAWRLAGSAAGLLIVVLTAIAVVGALFPSALSDAIYPAFPSATREKLTRLIAVSVPGCLPFGLATFLTSLHMARRRFLFASLSQALQPIGGLISLVLFHEDIGILALAVGVVGGVVLQCVILGAPVVGRLARHGFARLGETALARMLSLLPALIVAAVFSKGFAVLEKRYGALLEEGSLSHMTYGWKLVVFLFFLVSNGVLQSSFTYLSETAATDDRDELRRRTAAITRGLLLVLLPVATAAFVFRVEAMRLFERGEFRPDDVRRASLAVTMYLPLLIVYSLQGVASHVFYALGRVWTVAVVSAGSLGVYVVLGPWLAESAASLGVDALLGDQLAASAGMAGLLAAFCVAVGAGYAAFVVLLRPLIGGIEGTALLATLARGVIAAAVTGALLEISRRLLGGPLSEWPFVFRAGLLAVLGCAGCLPYMLVVRGLGDRELMGVLRSLGRRKGGDR